MDKSYDITISGIVQGVGFRPFIYSLTQAYGIRGWINNEGASVAMHIEGKKSNIKRMIKEIVKHPPRLSKIESINIHTGSFYGYKGFRIKESKETNKIKAFISPDQGVCDKCMEEVNDPKSNRYRYPLTNCTDCGPRYSIIKALPYDRKSTTMSCFDMCSSCQEEYKDPSTRRFHAQPNCCNQCGPQIKLIDHKGNSISCDDPIKKTVELIKEGYILAIKGIGGFHLSCNGEDKKAIDILRKRKQRPHKPFAIMVKNIKEAEKLGYINEKEKEVLLSNTKPILLLRKKSPFILPDSIAPNMKNVGIFLPYTPLHYLLFDEGIHYLVMTSGNISNRPIEYKNEEALYNLNGVADYFLLHDREIENPIDDSVGRVLKDKLMISRPARGIVPFSFIAYKKGRNTILGLGSEQKNTFTIMNDHYMHLSPYVGDLKNLDTLNTYKKIIYSFTNLFRLKPNIIAHDLHPNYVSTHYGYTLKGKKIGVQHHHAHMVSCMVEHQLEGKVIGVIYDGTGYGDDGAVWGGEFFVGNRREYKRVGHLSYVTLQGGDFVMKELYRTALGYLSSLEVEYAPPFKDISIIKQALSNKMNCFITSSIGRLFDCVAALTDLCVEATYDAQGAIELESCINEDIKDSYEYVINQEEPFIISYEEIIKGVIKDKHEGKSLEEISTKFHNTICNFTIDGVNRISEKYLIRDVVLSGGVFENQYLLSHIMDGLNKIGLKAYYNQKVPINDSGISFGQVEIARAILEGD